MAILGSMILFAASFRIYCTNICQSGSEYGPEKRKHNQSYLYYQKILFLLRSVCVAGIHNYLSLFDPRCIYDFSRAIHTSLMVQSPNLRRGASLRPKGETRKGFSFTLKWVPLPAIQKQFHFNLCCQVSASHFLCGSKWMTLGQCVIYCTLQ